MRCMNYIGLLAILACSGSDTTGRQPALPITGGPGEETRPASSMVVTFRMTFPPA